MLCSNVEPARLCFILLQGYLPVVEGFQSTNELEARPISLALVSTHINEVLCPNPRTYYLFVWLFFSHAFRFIINKI